MQVVYERPAVGAAGQLQMAVLHIHALFEVWQPELHEQAALRCPQPGSPSWATLGRTDYC